MAPVLGIVGVLLAVGAGAHDVPAANQSDDYATEALTRTDGQYAISATPLGTIVLDVEIDTLIEADADSNHYLVIDFGDAELRAQVNLLTNPGVTDNEQYMSPDPDGDGTRSPGPVSFPIAGDAGELDDPDTTDTNEAEPPEQPMLPRGEGILFYTYTESTTETADDANDGVDDRSDGCRCFSNARSTVTKPTTTASTRCSSPPT